MQKLLMDLLVCPLCKGKLVYQAKAKELVCRYDKLAYSINDGIPMMLPDEARPLNKESN